MREKRGKRRVRGKESRTEWGERERQRERHINPERKRKTKRN